MSKEKEKAFPDKLKQFFKLQRSGSLTLPKPAIEEVPVNKELLHELSCGSTLIARTKILKELCEIMKKKRMNHICAVRIWETIKDLLSVDVPREYRHICLHFLVSLTSDPMIQGNSTLKLLFFDAMKNHILEEDIFPKLEVIKVLTENGKDLDYLEDEIGQFLVEWFPQIITSANSINFLPMLVNIIKFHTAYLGEDIIAQHIHNTCYLSCYSNNIKEKDLCLDVFDAVVCYSYLPPEVLSDFVIALCRSINTVQLCLKTWEVMFKLLGTCLGHSALCTLCEILQDDKHIFDIGLLRGAVFFISMGLWGNPIDKKKRPTLKHTPLKVLPSFKMALRCGHHLVVFEVCLSMLRLVGKMGNKTDPNLGDKTDTSTWMNILDIIDELYSYIEKNHENFPEIWTKLHEILTAVEFLYENKKFPPSLNDRLFGLTEKCFKDRNDKSVCHLLDYKMQFLQNGDQFTGMSRMESFFEQFFKNESRYFVKIKCLDALFYVLKVSSEIHEEEILEFISTKCLCSIDQEPNVYVREHVVRLFLKALDECNPVHCLSVYEIFDKILFKPFITQSNGGLILRENELQDVNTLVSGLISLLLNKLDICNPEHTIHQYKCLVKHLLNYFETSTVGDKGTSIKLKIFQCLFQIRADESFHIGFPDLEKPGLYKYSRSVVIEQTKSDGSVAPIPTSLSVLPIASIYKAVTKCLEHENDWNVLEYILNQLPDILQDSVLILSQSWNNIDKLANALCSLVSNPNGAYPSGLRNLPKDFNKLDFHRHVYLSIGHFSSYGRFMIPSTQQLIVKCLLTGTMSKSCQPCVSALTICTLEMRTTMHKLLRNVLFSLSKISATVHTAQSVLDFLSTLIRLPEIYASCVEEQYLEIFAIALPYTNTFKFKYYIVSQAYQIIALWFVRCRQPFRQRFVRYILKGLEGNVLSLSQLRPQPRLTFDRLNEDSANRRRSASMVERGTRTRNEKVRPPLDEGSLALHQELTEACLDFMSRYAFATVASKPRRFRLVDFILSSGQSKTWMMGTKLITITTSGCFEKPMKDGMCEKCYQTCHKPEGNTNVARRRHMSAFVSTTSQDLASPLLHSKDDLHMNTSSMDSLAPKITRITEQMPVEDEDEECGKNMTLCSCVCQGYAEIYIRRPTGDVSWVMQVQNSSEDYWGTDTHSGITDFFFPSSNIDKNFEILTRKRIDSENIDEKTYEEILTQIFQAEYPSPDVPSRQFSHPPSSSKSEHHDLLQRSLSGPEMHGESDIGLNPSKDLAARSHQIVKSSLNIPPMAPKGNKSVVKAGNGRSFSRILDSNNSGTVLPLMRDRSATISNPVRPDKALQTKIARKSGISPSFVFLQLYYGSGLWTGDKNSPILLPDTSKLERTLKVLDLKKPYETHKIGVVYIAPGQAHVESEILSNQYGSHRYVKFLQSLGDLIKLSDVDPQTTFLGGLEQSGKDGKFAYKWSEDIMKIIFHVATLMPNYADDKSCNRKKRHIGNNYVAIVYNESGKVFDIQTLKGQLLYACIVIEPMNYNFNRVKLISKPEIEQELEILSTTIMSDESLAIRTRQMALRTNLCAMIQKSKTVDGLTYANNWLERLRHIKKLKDLPTDSDANQQAPQKTSLMDDFTLFV